MNNSRRISLDPCFAGFIGGCQKNTNQEPKTAHTPIKCGSSHTKALQGIKKKSNFNGPWVNVAITEIPTNAVIGHEYAKGLNDLSRTKPPPSEKDWWKERPDAIEDGSLNQGKCGTCWAFSSTTVLADRVAIKHNIQKPNLAPGWTATCLNNWASSTQQCVCGGSVYVAACMFKKKGTKLESCFPYHKMFNPSNNKKKQDWQAPTCPKSDEYCYNCQDSPNANVFFKTADDKDAQYVVQYKDDSKTEIDNQGTIIAIQQDIMTNGPVATSFNVYNEFPQWWKTSSGTDDIYTPKEASVEGGHAVAIVGWGYEDEKLFWIMRNSWGNNGKPSNISKKYGGGGFCRMMASWNPITNKAQFHESLWTGLDIPIIFKKQRLGGCVSFLSTDKLPSGWKGIPSTSSKPGGKRNGSVTSNINWKLIIIVVFILLLAVVVFFVVKYKTKKN